MNHAFSYATAFSRNLGWVTQPEQDRLRLCRVAIAGMGGVGGGHLLTLARLGIGKFTIADPDIFEEANFNRQAGAFLSTAGLAKAPTMQAMALDINPEADIRTLKDYVDASNVDEFLRDADLFVDAIDAFSIRSRRVVYAACKRLRIPAVSVGPLGMSSVMINFLPGQMSFEDYFQLEGYSEADQILRFAIGLMPTGGLQRAYLVEPHRMDLKNRRGPSTAMGCQLCSGVMGTEALKILLGRGRVWAAPHSIQFDAYRNKLVRTWRPGGNRNPLQRLMFAMLRRKLHSAGALP